MTTIDMPKGAPIDAPIDLPAAPVATRIEQVTVYRNGALVKRRGCGRGRVEVRGLPLLFSSDTLRVRPVHGTIRELEETVQLQATPAPLPVTEDEQVALALQLAQVDDEIRGCTALAQAADRLMPELPDPQLPVALADPARFAELLSLAERARADALERKAEAEGRRRQLERARQRLLAKKPAEQEPPRVLRGARFTLAAEKQVEFELEYFVHAARWVPSYALHLQDGRARLVVAAMIAQATGEDWRDVTVAVSTADLLRESTLPAMSSWRIGRAQPAVPRGYRALPSDLPALFWGFDQQPRRPARHRAEKPPSPPSPPVAAEPHGFDKLSTAEVRSFEEERTDATMRSLADVDLDESEEADLGDGLDDTGAAEEVHAVAMDALEAPAEPEQSMTRAGVARRPSRLSMSPPPAAAPMAAGLIASSSKMAAPMGGASPTRRGAQRAEDAAVVSAHAELPPRWRTAYLRMAGPDEGERGTLVALDPTERLAWLLEAHDVEGEGRAELRRAIDALLVAQQRLRQAPLPRGTSALLGTHYQSVLRAAAATDVPGDGAFYRVEVRADEGPAHIEHRALPRSSNDVWRVCKVDVKGAPLPSGPLAVWEDGAFRVNAHLDGSGGGKALEVNLGVDPDVRVLSRTAQVHQAEKGLMNQTSRVEHQVHVELRSTAAAPAKLVLWDRLPVPVENLKDVSVQLLEERPPAKRSNKDAAGNEVPGALEWRLTLMPGTTMNIDYRYAIDLPAKAELEGGNRRE